MTEERFDKIEAMLSKLISTVGQIMEEQTAMRNEQLSMKEEQASMKKEQEIHHQEILDKLSTMQADQDHNWQKIVKNERDIGIMKNLLKL